MSAARNTQRRQASVATGVPNYNSSLFRGAFTATYGQVAARQVRIQAGLIQIQNDLEDIYAQDLRGPPGPPGEPGYIDVNYSEDASLEYPLFSTQRIASQWTISDADHRQTDLSTHYGFLPLGGQFSTKDATFAYPFYHESAASFIPMETNQYTTSVPVSSVDLPNFVEVPFHSDRIIKSISWNCPEGIAARFIVVGKPEIDDGSTNYVTKYYQIQGSKLFEEIPMGNSVITTQQRNSVEHSYDIPLANSQMPKMRSLATIVYDIRYVPIAQRATYDGNLQGLPLTDSVPSNESELLSAGIGIKCACANYIPI